MPEDGDDGDDKLVQWDFTVERVTPGTIDSYHWEIIIPLAGKSISPVLSGRDWYDPTRILQGVCDRFNEAEQARVNKSELGKRMTHVVRTDDDRHPEWLPEIRSIAAIKRALDSAGSDDARRRVLRWTQQYCADNGIYGHFDD